MVKNQLLKLLFRPPNIRMAPATLLPFRETDRGTSALFVPSVSHLDLNVALLYELSHSKKESPV